MDKCSVSPLILLPVLKCADRIDPISVFKKGLGKNLSVKGNVLDFEEIQKRNISE